MATLLKERSTYWALSNGSSANSNGDYRMYWKIYYEQSDSDKALNRTKLTVNYYVQISIGSHGEVVPPSTSSICYINGSSIGTKSFSSRYYDSSGLYSLGSATKYITHNADGTATFTFKGTGFGRNTALSTYTLPKINRGTTITNNSSTSNYINFGSNVSFSLTKPNTSDTNDVYYQIGSTTYSIASGTSDTSITYSFSTSLINNYPNNKEISLTVYCKNLVSGVITESVVYLRVPDTYKPSISLTLTEQNSVCKNWGIFVKSKSSVKGVISATAQGGSSIVGYSTTLDNSVYSTSQFTSAVLNPTISSGSSYVDISVVSNVTDSRGYSNSTSKSLRVYDYFAPTFIKAELKRCNADGTLNNRGSYAKVVCNYKIASCNSKNTKSLKVTYGSTTKTFTLSNYEGTITATSSQLFSGFDVGKSYNFTFVLTDSFGNTTLTVVLKNSYITRSFKPGGKGIAFGDKATEDGFHCYMSSRFHSGLQADGTSKVSDLLIDGNLMASNGTFTTDPTNSFQSTIFGSNNYYWRIKPIRSGINTNNKFPIYSSGIAFSGGDTHGVLFTEYQTQYARAYIGAGNSNKLNWMKEVAFKDDDWKTIWTGTLTGGKTLSLAVSSYSKLKVYAKCHSIVFNFEIDLIEQVAKTQVDGYMYAGSGVASYINDSSIIEQHSCEFLVNTAKTQVFVRHMGYVRGGTTYLRNDNVNYYVYKIEAK